ncbi:hypothetical protein QL285_011020 [Trifolium repens]|jgi:hypothetical protein|nr:hypothetical protein QL285_011020 [Trifolium repens]
MLLFIMCYGNISETVTNGGLETAENKQSLWRRDLMSLGTIVSNGSNWCVDELRLRLESAEKIKLWRKKWVVSQPLRHTFSRLYSMAAKKNATVSEVGEWSTW